MSTRRKGLILVGLGLGGVLVHALAAQALVVHGVAGALLAGGGGWGTILAAAAFLLVRLASFVALAAVPAVIVGAVLRHRASTSESSTPPFCSREYIRGPFRPPFCSRE